MGLRRDLYIRANAELIAKAIGELFYEELLKPQALADSTYRLNLGEVSYTFTGSETIWSSLKVEATSIEREPQTEILSAAQFFIDIKEIHQMGDITLGNFLEELGNTLAREVEILAKVEKVSAGELLAMGETQLQSHLSGHPKILLNKGRLGWGVQDSNQFSPEATARFKLHWVALKKNLATASFAPGETMESVLLECMDSAELGRLRDCAHKLSAPESDFYYLPVHPWQWDHVIQIQFAYEFATGALIDLGVFGDDFGPQVSLRTLTNLSRQRRLDVKLPLSILNTSAIRGLPGHYIKAGVELSDYIQALADEDSLLSQSGLDVLKERAGLAYTGTHYRQVKEAPYRYHEFLGVTWRESAHTKAQEKQERALMTGALLFVDHSGQSLIGEIIKRSELTPSEWLKAYFQHVVTPLYHLQMKHGLGLVSHGQNIVLRLKNFRPCGVFIKDFGGDLRLALNFKERYQSVASMNALTTLPPNYLIHDLYTGHFITTLRYLSSIMAKYDNFSELDFYTVGAQVLSEYINQFPIGGAPNILAPTFERVLINAVRFDIGYGDSAQRPVPKLGSELTNPLYLGLQELTEDKEVQL